MHHITYEIWGVSSLKYINLMGLFYAYRNQNGVCFTMTQPSYPGLPSWLLYVATKVKKYNRIFYQYQFYRNIHNIIISLSLRRYILYVKNNPIPNLPVTWEDIVMSKDIFGTNLGPLKRNKLHQQPHNLCDLHQTIYISIIPKYQKVKLVSDAMNINGLTFLQPSHTI